MNLSLYSSDTQHGQHKEIIGRDFVEVVIKLQDSSVVIECQGEGEKQEQGKEGKEKEELPFSLP